MPNRIIRESIIDSAAVDQLSYPEEVFYRRLINKVDDFGRYDARPSILKANLYPLRLDTIREADISRWLAICEKAGLIALYEVAGSPFLVLFKLGEPRAKTSKFPPPPPDIVSSRLRADASICSQAKTYVPYSLSLPLSPPPAASEGEKSDPILDSLVKSFAEMDPAGGMERPAIAKKPSHARAHGALTAPQQARDAAMAAFDTWASLPPPIGRSYGVNEAADEHWVVWNLVEELACETPMPRGGEMVARYLLIPQVIEALRKASKPFKSVKFAVGCVRSELGDWANAGIPAAKAVAKKKPPGEYVVVKGFKG